MADFADDHLVKQAKQGVLMLLQSWYVVSRKRFIIQYFL